MKLCGKLARILVGMARSGEAYNPPNKFKLESEIRTKYQITIPEEIRVKAKLSVGDKLLWQYDEVRDEIIVMPKPKSFSDKLWGLGKELWSDEPSDDYVRKERENW
ncbi:AbrB/MazE/SpoVT family DNA-binding domain-containing protein [Paenibacillus sp. LHD-38]|uniref:AbrB/MazE/SpoVT family DNA-binding domain-containing protein n=1 Tax=Paenibacillus sp. LHD-38 TaxID=3072143 RepID=UPI00280D3C1A|nr:AbrB/MazE/SpoVT family DNA-binding domain-containing protein [Paenibacillus sp. LHD-38]MDQ8739029.1 AbrB/MazE/SpoVT family DNA-binding domain-containing protein [Paenibacillus sp. LHD-38]